MNTSSKVGFAKFISFSVNNQSPEDILQLKNLGNSSVWDNNAKVLHVEVSGKGDLEHIIDNLYLEGKSPETRAISAGYTNEKGEYSEFNQQFIAAFNNKSPAGELNYSNNIINHDITANYNINTDGVSNTLVNKEGLEINNYEEIGDYSFINVVTEEIVNLHTINNINDLKGILQDSIETAQDKHIKALSNANFDKIIKGFNPTGENHDNNIEASYQVFLHTLNNVSYVEVINHNENVFNLHLQGGSVSEIDSNGLDAILHTVVNHNNNNKA